MSKIDDAIQAALSKEDAEFLARFDERQGAVSEMTGLFRGPGAGFNSLFLVVAMLFGIGAAYAAWKFALAVDVRALAHWGALAAFGLLVVTVIRLWFFMGMHTNRIIRELKRLELQVARLAARDGDRA